MTWGTVEAEPEVLAWLEALPDLDFGHAAFYVDLLEANGPLLGEPYTRQLVGKLRELRFYLRRSQVRITYFIASGRRIVLLTVFRKHGDRAPAEIARAVTAMETCISEKHLALEGDD